MKQTFLLLIVFLRFTSIFSFAQAGTLDSSFGKDGKVILRYNNSNETNASSLAILENGKVLLGGYFWNGNNYDILLVRYKKNGVLDNKFGEGGAITTDFGEDDKANAIAVQADGKIIAAGNTGTFQTNYFLLVRYNANGAIDSSFGTNGKTLTDLGQNENATSIVLQSNGKIVLAGNVFLSSKQFLVLVRYKENGTVDSTFGNNGTALTKISDRAKGVSVAIQSNEKIVATSTFATGDGGYAFGVVRYKSNGVPDSTFGINGITITNVGYGEHDFAKSLAIQPNGKIIVAGFANNGNDDDFAMVRYKENGTIDNSFGSDGKVMTNFFDSFYLDIDECYAIAIQQNGKIVLAGYSNYYNIYPNQYWDFALARYTETGTPDSSFGINGKVTTDFENGFDAALAVAIQPDGKIIAAGSSIVNNLNRNMKLAAVRYLGDSFAAKNASQNFSNLQKQNNVFTSILLSPNPVKDLLRIEGLSSSAKTISVFDAKGKLLKQATTANSSYLFNTKGLSVGTYFLKIDEGDKTNTVKFIKD